MKSAKDIAALIIGKPKHPMQGLDDGDLPGGDDDADGDGDEQYSLIAGDILDAIKNDEPEALADALRTFVESVSGAR